MRADRTSSAMFDDHALRVLEYHRILKTLSGYAHWAPGREKLEALRPCAVGAELLQLQSGVREAWALSDRGGVPLAGGLADVRPIVHQARIGQTLSGQELLALREFAAHLRQVVRYYNERVSTAPLLASYLHGVRPQPRLENEIGKAIASDGHVLDHATPKLAHLRHEIRRHEAGIQDSLQRFLRQPDVSRMLQETIVTSRQGRWVVPVKAGHRSLFPGLVIDQSSSGSTLFMEPWLVVEPGNQLRAATLAEEQEVTAILSRLSGLVAFEADALLAGVDAVAWLDMIFAIAAYGRDVRGTLPELGTADLHLKGARHPLLLEQVGLEVVPISIHMREDQRTVVVTGPNTGGKTVALKTIGLLSLLALTGLAIPVEQGSRVPGWHGVYADIGDEQAIAQNLSTFSGHVSQILHLLPQAHHGTLVLLDELGAGTDPSEGSALGKALLATLHERGAWSVVTTHLSDLKTFAAETEGMVNASVEFDIETLRPTYKLVMGTAGRSNALQIAARLGLPDDVLQRARHYLGQGSQVVNQLLSDLEVEREATRRRDAALAEARRELEGEREALVQARQRVETERTARLHAAQQEGRQVVATTRQEVHELLRATREALARVGAERDAQRQQAERLTLELVERLAQDPVHLAGLSEDAAGLLGDALRRVSDRLWVEEPPPPEPPPPEADEQDDQARVVVRTAEARLAELLRVLDGLAPASNVPPRSEVALAPGQPVYVHSFGQEGRVVRVSGGRVEVQVGAMRLRVRPEELETL